MSAQVLPLPYDNDLALYRHYCAKQAPNINYGKLEQSTFMCVFGGGGGMPVIDLSMSHH